jgi:N-acetylglucosamine-6-phosphate deacetylase
MPTLAAARVVTPTGVLEPGVVAVDGGVVAEVAPTRGPVPERTLVPGFVDLQVNGHDDVDVARADGADWDRLDGLLAAQGVTTWCPTVVTAPLASYDGAFDRIAKAAARAGDDRPAVAGVHLEGPFLGAMPGAHPPELLRPLDDGWLAALPPLVRVVTLGPELHGAATSIARLAGRGVLVSIGHSAASLEEAEAAVDAGARLVTHCFNGMPPLHHREPGLVGAALSDPRLAVSLIADLVHVHPAALTIAFRAKGRGGVVLVTDAVGWRSRGIGDIRIRHDGTAPRLADGTLAGSALTMDRAVANVVTVCGVSLEDAVAAASTTPAALLGLDDRGALAPGRRADIVALTRDLQVEATWVGGRQIHG